MFSVVLSSPRRAAERLFDFAKEIDAGYLVAWSQKLQKEFHSPPNGLKLNRRIGHVRHQCVTDGLTVVADYRYGSQARLCARAEPTMFPVPGGAREIRPVACAVNLTLAKWADRWPSWLGVAL